ncbi:MAG: hypothetical protein ACKVT0_06560 [Planctomycetaceae bacterium]
MHAFTNARCERDRLLSMVIRHLSMMIALAVGLGPIGFGSFAGMATGQEPEPAKSSAEQTSDAPVEESRDTGGDVPSLNDEAESTLPADAVPTPVAIPADAVELPAEVFATVPMRSLDMTMEEAPAYYAILNHAARVPPAKLRESALTFRQSRHRENPKLSKRPFDKFPQFVDLFQNPDTYRGKPVTLTGYTRRVRSIVADKNEYGIDTLHEIWLFTDDSQNNPVVIVCTEIPKDLPQGDRLLNGISVTGYFFKLYGYDDSGDDKRLAPMILAHRLQWSPPKSGFPEISPWVIYPGIIMLLSAVIAAIWYVMRRDQLASPLKRTIDEAPETIGTPPVSGTPTDLDPPPFVTDTPAKGN